MISSLRFIWSFIITAFVGSEPTHRSELGRNPWDNLQIPEDLNTGDAIKLHSRPLAAAVTNDVLFVVHQTNKVKARDMLSAEERKWQSSWLWLNFRVSLSDDEDCRNDVKRLSTLLSNNAYLNVYDRLETPVQRADFWRYTRLYLEGGIYADLDVVARANIRPLLQKFFCEDCSRVNDQIVFVESDWFADGLLGKIALTLKFTDMVRLPQFRQCILIAGVPHHPLYKLTLDMIVESFTEGLWRYQEGLARTLLLTGPGVFTDAVHLYQKMHGDDTIQFISRHDGHYNFEHMGVGSWKRKETHYFQEKPGIIVLIASMLLLWVLMLCIPAAGRRTWLKLKSRYYDLSRALLR